MYSILNELLSDKKGGEIFSCFGVWHGCYIALAALAAVVILVCLRHKGGHSRERVMRLLVGVAFGLYVADFFLMPIAYGEIDIEKLPFHVCTAMCVMCFLSLHHPFWSKYRVHFALLGFISNLVYLIYPAGVMWHQVHPLSYRVVQTLLFHGTMTVYGLLVLVCDSWQLTWKRCYRDLAVLCGMTLWAWLGNLIYNGEAGTYAHFFNWFFVVRDPFHLLPPSIAPYVMPWLNVAVFFGAEMLVYVVCRAIWRKIMMDGRVTGR